MDESDCAEAPNVNFILTFPEQTGWQKLHPCGSHYTMMNVRLWIEVEKMSRMTAKSWPTNFNVDLSEYYDYCRESDINVLGHTVDFAGDSYKKPHKCGISFYFASIKDKAHFILKYK